MEHLTSKELETFRAGRLSKRKQARVIYHLGTGCTPCIMMVVEAFPPPAIVGSLSPERLQELLALASPQHPKLKAEMDAVAGLGPAVSTTFNGPRDTALSGEAWTDETVVRALRDVGSAVASSESGDAVLLTVRNLEPSLAQSALTGVALEKGWAKENEKGEVEWVKFGRVDPGWLECVLERVKTLYPCIADRPKLPEDPDPLPNQCKLAVVGDWGTNLYGAPKFREWASQFADWDAVVHLGDTYYAGTTSEVEKRLSQPWPVQQSLACSTLSRFLNGNHEMYSGGQAYFSFISSFKQARPQASSCFAMQNADWMLVGLDTSWHGIRFEPSMQNGCLDDDQIEWLKMLVGKAGNRRVILLSHHPPFHFTGSENAALTTKLQWLWAKQKVFGWYFGHEHFGVRYDMNPYGFVGRCLGHGGVPEPRKQVARNSTSAQAKPIPGTQCAWKSLQTSIGGQQIQTWVLDGPNPLVVTGRDAQLLGPLHPRADHFAPHGWAVLKLNGPNLVEDCYLADGEISLPLP